MGNISAGRCITPSAVSDTHAAIWYLNADHRLSSRAKAFIKEAEAQGNPVLISTSTLVEVIYLQEKGKIPLGTLTRLEEALRAQDAGLRVADLTLTVAQ